MARIKLASWNVNGIRAVAKKGFHDWLSSHKPDIACIQETKISRDKLGPEIVDVDSYHTYWACAEKKGYSGVAILARKKPVSVSEGMGINRFDTEGRVIVADYQAFTLLNIYYPNGKASPERLQYKLDFYNAFLDYAQSLRKKGRPLVVCGDFNTAHKEIDLARPRANETESGFLPVERKWMDKFVEHGYIDTFRAFNQNADEYSWWHMRTRARERNVGWRIDYFFVSDELKENLSGASIDQTVMGSDHCPVTLELKF